MKLLFTLFSVLLIIACETPPSNLAQTIAAENEIVIEAIEETNETAILSQNDSTSFADNETMYLIQQGKLGLFEIGMSQTKVEELLIRYNNLELQKISRVIEGMAYPALELTFNNTDTVLLEISEADSIVCRIEIYTNLFKTEKNISIGSTYLDLQNNYTFDGIQWGDNGDPIVIVEDLSMSFFIDPGDWWQMGQIVEDIPQDTKITKIILW